MPLGLIPKILDASDMVVAVCEKLRMVDPEMAEIRDIQYVVAPPAVRIYDVVRWLLGECEAITEKQAQSCA
jgi:hypothetical protein